MECVLPESCQLTHTKQVQPPRLVSVCVCVYVCLHKRGSAGFPGSGNIPVCKYSHWLHLWSQRQATDGGICLDRADELQITAGLTPSGCERITEECDVDR